MALKGLLERLRPRGSAGGAGVGGLERHFFPVLGCLLACLFLTLQFRMNPAGGDAVLYSGLADNLLQGRGYVDNVRHDEIIPPIGHPLVLAAVRRAGWPTGNLGFLLIFLSIALVFHLGLAATRAWWAGLALAGLFVLGCHRHFNVDGAEASILFFNTLLVWSLARALSSRKPAWYAFSGTAALAAILIRPSLLIALLILSLWAAARIFSGKPFPGRAGLWFYAPLLGGLAAAAGLSQSRYGDLRYLSGTYGSIPVYCAFNGHIDLRQPYHSELWSGLPPDRLEAARRPMVKTTDWRARARALKAEIRDFVRRHPRRALSGVVWRLKTYTFWNTEDRYLFFFWLSVLSLAALWLAPLPGAGQARLAATLFFALGMWIVFMKLFFVYTDNRYTIDMMPYFIMPPAMLAGALSARLRRARPPDDAGQG